MYKRSIKVAALFLCLSMLVLFPINSLAQEMPFELQSQGGLLMDYDTGTILYEKNIHEKLPIASITKVMTTLLTLEAIAEGRIDLEDEVTVSEYAAGMGGSQVFLEAGEILPVSAILKAIIVASANDASVAIAEKISGTVETFVNSMNKKLMNWGWRIPHFSDCTGLSDDGNYSTVYDISIMSREILKYPLFFNWSTIWLENLEEAANNTMLTNTNRLVRFYDGCDGIKTGFTSKLSIALLQVQKRQLASNIIVLAAPTSQVRFSEASKLMDYGFANYEAIPLIKKDSPIEKDIMVTGGKEKEITGLAAEDFSILQQKDNPMNTLL